MNKGISFLELLKGKHVVLFDSSLEDEIKSHKWFINSNGYVMCSGATCGYNYMHQFVLGFSGNGKMVPDHINMIKTDNRRCNLRIISQKENVSNRVIRDDTLRGTSLTENEIELLRFANSFVDDKGIFPTFEAIMEEFNFKSPNSVTQYLKSLVSKNALKRHPAKKYTFTEVSNSILN